MLGHELPGFYEHARGQPFEKLRQQHQIQRGFDTVMNQLRHRKPNGARNPSQEDDRDISLPCLQLREVALRHFRMCGQCLARHAALIAQHADPLAELAEIGVAGAG